MAKRLEVGEDAVETIAEVVRNVIAIEAYPVAGMESSRGASYQDGVRQKGLKVTLGGEQKFPVTQPLVLHGAQNNADSTGTCTVRPNSWLIEILDGTPYSSLISKFSPQVEQAK